VSDHTAGFFSGEADVMKIDCLMGTYGRHALACEALACFLQQSELSNATLLVYNQHPVPLRFNHPRVRVVNEAPPVGSLRHIRKRMLELSDPSADLIHWWEDDDLYLPWHLKDCLDHLARLHQLDAIFTIFGASDRDKRLILQGRGLRKRL
jgi:hypothetical protein